MLHVPGGDNRTNSEGEGSTSETTENEEGTRKNKGHLQQEIHVDTHEDQTLNTMIKPEALYASETLILMNKRGLENIQKEERKIMRIVLGPRYTDKGYRLQSWETIADCRT